MRLPSARGPLMVLEHLDARPKTTSELYDEIGYLELMRCGLIPYGEFKRVLRELEAEGLAGSDVDEDEQTRWRRT